jgi:hypothetical protein
MDEHPGREKCRERIEAALRDYAGETGLVTMPIVEDWVVVATFSDMDGDAGNGQWMHLRPKNSWSHRAVGLLTTASDDLRGIAPDEDD